MSGLGELAVSERDRAIIDDVWRFRLLTSRQLERLHFPPSGDGTPASAARRARRVLRRLVEQRYLDPLGRRIGGVRAGSGATIYAPGIAAQALFTPEQRRRRLGTPGDRFIRHTLAIGELAVRVSELVRYTADLDVLRVDPEPFCWLPYDEHGESRFLKPDLLVALEDLGADTERWTFVEIDRDTEAQPTLRNKCARYLDAYHDGAEPESGIFPLVIFVCPSVRRAQSVGKAWRRMPPPAADLFSATTDDQASWRLAGRSPPSPGAAHMYEN